MLSHWICRVDVGDQYEANSRETSFEDIVCNRSEQYKWATKSEWARAILHQKWPISHSYSTTNT